MCVFVVYRIRLEVITNWEVIEMWFLQSVQAITSITTGLLNIKDGVHGRTEHMQMHYQGMNSASLNTTWFIALEKIGRCIPFKIKVYNDC